MDAEFEVLKDIIMHISEVQKNLAEMRAVLEKSRHHTTGFHENEFADMNLFDILEMLADWKAASRRSPGLSFVDSLPKAFQKYSIPENMQKHIRSTLEYLGWI